MPITLQFPEELEREIVRLAVPLLVDRALGEVVEQLKRGMAVTKSDAAKMLGIKSGKRRQLERDGELTVTGYGRVTVKSIEAHLEREAQRDAESKVVVLPKRRMR